MVGLFERRLLPARLEKSSFGKYLVLVRAIDFSPVSARKDGSFGQIGIGMVSQCSGKSLQLLVSDVQQGTLPEEIALGLESLKPHTFAAVCTSKIGKLNLLWRCCGSPRDP